MFSLLPPAFAAVPQYFIHISVAPKPLTEPDKRISHTSGSSVSHSVSLRPTTWVQVFADFRDGPVLPGHHPFEHGPVVTSTLALAVEPFEQNLLGDVNVVATFSRVIRDGIVVQVPDDFHLGDPDHLSFGLHTPGSPCPIGKIRQALAEFLATGPAFHLEIPILGFATVVGETQEGEIVWFAVLSLRVFACKASEFDAFGLFLRQL